IYQSFLGLIKSNSAERLANFSASLPGLIEDMKRGNYSAEFLRRYTLDTLAGPGLQVLSCSCGLHMTVNKAAPEGLAYKCPASGFQEYQHKISVDKDASVILKEALEKPKPFIIVKAIQQAANDPKDIEKP
ncbi:MAG: hypothetical protein V1897_18975, partial [Pseudomonadota bacterium]